MDPGSLVSLALIPLCLVVLAFDVAAETALANISRLRLHQLLDRGVPRASALAGLLNESRLATVLRTTNLIAATVLAALVVGLMIHLSGDLAGAVLILALMTLFTIVLGLLAPQALAVRHPERTALLLLGYIAALRLVIGPPLRLLYWLARPLARLLDSGREAGHYITEEEMRQLVDTHEDEGAMAAEEEEMIQQIFAFSDTTAHEVMVPRRDMVVVSDDDPFAVAVDRILQHGYTRLPVYHETIDNIVGVVNAKDLLRALHQGHTNHPLVEFVRPAHFVPETKKVDDLLRDLQRTRLTMAIVVDEYGGTAGMVTIEDLVEEIVGDIQDEYDREPVLLEEVSATEWRCDARLPLDDLNDLLGTKLEGVDVETVGGLVQERLGRIPTVEDRILEGDIEITVLATEGLRVKQLRIRRGEEPAAPVSPPAPEAVRANSSTSPAAPLH